MFLFRRAALFYAVYCVSILGAEPLVSLSEQIKKIIPSVVKIKVQRSESSGDDTELLAIDTGGSGFVIDSDHHIITNAHVIKNGKKIVVIDSNDKEYPAQLIGKDDKTDIAVLESSAYDAPFLSALENAAPSTGDQLFVIGSPFSLGHSVSGGIVSATNRFISNYPYLAFIQTDASINPGNSGGPVVNRNGELIGMASTYYSRQGNYTNVGFALGIDDVRRIAQELIKNSKIERGYMGADLLISERLVRKMGYQSAVFITRVYPQSPAEQSGLKAGDLIIGIGSENFRDSGTLHRLLEHSRPEESIQLTYVRGKKTSSVILRLSATPEPKNKILNIGTADQAEKLGLILSENNGAGIEAVITYGAAKTAGIDPRDKIEQINGTAVNTIKEFNTQLIKLGENEIAMLTITRNGESIVLPITSQKALKGYSTEN